MVKQIINIGGSANDHTGDGIRTAFTKANQNFDELYTVANSALLTTGGTLTGTLTLYSGTASVPSLNIPAGALLTTPAAGTLEWDGQHLFITQTGNVRKTVAFNDLFVGDAGFGGQSGLVPAPAAGDATRFLRGDGAWADAGGGTGTLSNGSVTNTYLASMANFTIKGRFSPGVGPPEDLTPSQVRTVLDLADLYVGANSAASLSSLTVTGTITHSGLVPSSGTNIDQVHSQAVSITLTDQWQDTGINSSTLATGTYFVQMLVNNSFVGGSSVNEYYSGMMSWFGADTDDTVDDEIVLHRAGNKAGTNRLYLKTVRTLSASPNDLKLQVSSLHNDMGSTSLAFQFRRVI